MLIGVVKRQHNQDSQEFPTYIVQMLLVREPDLTDLTMERTVVGL
jgi:hypothetical protein